jgi:RNA polymerase sigma factor (sigma-70 family)
LRRQPLPEGLMVHPTVKVTPIDFSFCNALFSLDPASLLGRRPQSTAVFKLQITRQAMTRSIPDEAFAESERRWSALMVAAQAGDGAAYAELLRRCVPLVKSVARRRNLPADRIDDVVQDVLLTVHRARHTYDPSRSFTAWLSVIADRRAIDVVRRTRRQALREVHAPLAFETHADETADPARRIVIADEAATASRVLEALPTKQREAVQYLVLEEHSLADAAVLTRRSKDSLKVNLHRALKALRGKMERVK